HQWLIRQADPHWQPIDVREFGTEYRGHRPDRELHALPAIEQHSLRSGLHNRCQVAWSRVLLPVFDQTELERQVLSNQPGGAFREAQVGPVGLQAGLFRIMKRTVQEPGSGGSLRSPRLGRGGHWCVEFLVYWSTRLGGSPSRTTWQGRNLERPETHLDA